MSSCDICDELAAIKAEQAWDREALTLLLQNAGLQVPGSAPAGFQVDAVEMAIGDWISSTVNWSDSAQGSLVVWLKAASGVDNVMGIFRISGTADVLSINTFSDVVSAYVFDSTQSNYVYGDSGDVFNEDLWFPILMDWKTDETAGNKILQVYIGDTSWGVTAQDDGTGSFSVTWSGQTVEIGHAAGNLDFVGGMSEFWFDTARLDFSVEANRRKFVSATGKPVDVGTDGSTPTGSAPEIYLSVRPGDAAADFVTNRGTGNNFTQNGTLTLSGTSPSD